MDLDRGCFRLRKDTFRVFYMGRLRYFVYLTGMILQDLHFNDILLNGCSQPGLSCCSRYVIVLFGAEPFDPVVESSGIDIMLKTPLLVGQAAAPALHDQVILFIS
jgi:hypothetical protein